MSIDNQPIQAVKIKIVSESSDGSKCETSDIVPDCIFDELMTYVIKWRENMICSFNEHEEFLESKKYFPETLDKR